MTNPIIFRGKCLREEVYVEGTYHYSNDMKNHYILCREAFMDRIEEFSLYKQEVHSVDYNSIEQFHGYDEENIAIWKNINL